MEKDIVTINRYDYDELVEYVRLYGEGEKAMEEKYTDKIRGLEGYISELETIQGEFRRAESSFKDLYKFFITTYKGVIDD